MIRMLIQNYVSIKWSGRNRKLYEGLGYKFTKIGDEFKVHIVDMPKGSNHCIRVACDYCGTITSKQIYHYFKEREIIIKKDACRKCCNVKNKEINLLKYGVASTQQLEHVKEKTKKTMIERYGHENPMKNDDIKDKLKKSIKDKYGVYHIFKIDEFKEKAKSTMRDRYGVDWYTRTAEYKERSVATCLERYGVEHFLQSDKIQEMRTGENNPNWKGGFKHHRNKRDTPEYRAWRKYIFEKCDYTCQKCGIRGHLLNAHHIHNYATNKELRFDINNGIALCENCHKEFHHINGYLDTDDKQLEKFLNKGVELCQE